MSTERIQAALRDATDTKDVVIDAGVLTSVGEIFSRTFGDVPAVVVADENTYKVAGEEVHRRLMAAGRTMVDPYVFPGRPTLRAEYGNITTLVGWLRTHDAIPVAVASGTLNDIVKRAAHECDRPYMTARAVRQSLALHRKWAEAAPTNYAAPYELIQGVWMRARGDRRRAEQHLARAIALAEQHQLPLISGLAHEEAGALHAQAGRAAASRAMIRTAHLRWVGMGMTVRDVGCQVTASPVGARA